MNPFTENKACSICSLSIVAGLRQAIFTAECSHIFHFNCINNYVSVGNRHCPKCCATWNNLPFFPSSPINPFSVHQNNFRPFHYQYPTFNRQQFESEPEPLQFCDDEPLLVAADRMSTDSLVEKVTIKATPQRLALAAAESASLFSVLVKLTAPPLSGDARSSQRAPIDIVTVLDVSGSMTGMKLDLVKRAVYFVIDNLGVCDRLSIVSFSDRADRRFPLKRMTDGGREEAKRAVASLFASGGTNIAGGLTKGVQVLDERRYKNPVSSIIFLSDGNDTCNLRWSLQNVRNSSNATEYGQLLPPSIFPRNQGSEAQDMATVPVHSFGFGSDHDPITMHAISDASGGTFSFIESIEMVQDAFASCIGGLMSVVTHELRLKLRSASHGVEIKSIPSGRYRSEVSDQGSQGLINVGDLYADEEKEFLINLSIPACNEEGEEEDSKRKTSLLDITCSYKDAVSKEAVEIDGELVELKRPKVPSSQDMAANLEVDRQRNRLLVAESIKQAQQMAEAGNLNGATKLLAKSRDDLMQSDAGKAGDGLVRWLEGEMKETEIRMGSAQMYQQSGRAFALSGMSSHASQRATTRGGMVAGAAAPSFGAFGSASSGFGGSAMFSGSAAGCAAPSFGGYATPQMANMVSKSRLQTKTEEEGNIPKKE